MKIRLIMKITGLCLIAAAITVLAFISRPSLIILGGVNLLVFILEFFLYYEERKNKIRGVYHKICLTIYTAGLFWIGYGLYRLWKDAPEIEEKIKARREIKAARRTSDDSGALSLTTTRDGGMSIVGKE